MRWHAPALITLLKTVSPPGDCLLPEQCDVSTPDPSPQTSLCLREHPCAPRFAAALLALLAPRPAFDQQGIAACRSPIPITQCLSAHPCAR
eukprot:6173880-Pleurochrysis_carterae.AAC.5